MDSRPDEPKQLTEHDIAEQKYVLEDKIVNKTKNAREQYYEMQQLLDQTVN